MMASRMTTPSMRALRAASGYCGSIREDSTGALTSPPTRRGSSPPPAPVPPTHAAHHAARHAALDAAFDAALDAGSRRGSGAARGWGTVSGIDHRLGHLDRLDLHGLGGIRRLGGRLGRRGRGRRRRRRGRVEGHRDRRLGHVADEPDRGSQDAADHQRVDEDRDRHRDDLLRCRPSCGSIRSASFQT